MLFNNLKIAWRSILRNPFFSLINVIGMALGMLCCLYIVIYVQYEFGFDQDHPQGEDIYRVTTILDISGEKVHMATSSPPIGPALQADFPDVITFTRVVKFEKLGVPQSLIFNGETSFYEKDVILVDSTFFSLFSFPFLEGHPDFALDQPNTAVLDKSIAEKLFGTESALDKVIRIYNNNGSQDFVVKGVVDVSQKRSHLVAKIFLSMNSGGMGSYVRENDVWAGNNFVSTYIKLSPGSISSEFESKIPAFLEKYGGEELRKFGMGKELVLQPITDVHTGTGLEAEMAETISPTFLYVLLLIAFLLQLVACINFMNLSTAKASKRAKEVGVRKVIGAGKGHLFGQFLGESLLLVLFSAILALLLLSVMLPYLNQLTGTSLDFSVFMQKESILFILIIVILTGMIAGSYPAFYLSSFNAVSIMKGNLSSRISATRIRQVLVTSQFVFSIALITGITIIQSQMRYLNSIDLGFEKEQRLIFNFYTIESKEKMKSLAEAFRGIAQVEHVSIANNYPSQFVFNDRGVFLEGGDMQNAQNAQFMMSDENFVKANGISIIQGRDLLPSDSNKVLINERLFHELQLTEETSIGTKLYSQYGTDPAFSVEIVGVMKDFHYNSLHKEVRPFMLIYSNETLRFSHMILAVNDTNYSEVIEKLQSAWNQLLPDTPFDYFFLDQKVQQQYEKELVLSKVIQTFTYMTIFISCLGLLGLAAFSSEQRKKEIGIRKTLGASVGNVVLLLSKEYVRLVAIAMLISFPIAWWVMDRWLADFAYKVTIEWWMFAFAGFAALTIALLTVISQSLKAANSNPINSLGSE